MWAMCMLNPMMPLCRVSGPSTHPRTAPPARRGSKTERDTHKNTHTPQHLSQEWWHAAETRAQAHTPTLHNAPGTAAYRRSAHTTTHAPKQQPRMVVCKPKPKPNRRQHKSKPGMEEQTHNPYPNTPTEDPSQGWQGNRNPSPSTTRPQTQTPHNNRKPSVHSPGTEAARAMQVTRPNEIHRPGVRLHPKACAALGLKTGRVRPKRLGIPVPRTCMHALGTGYARKSGEPLGFRPKGGDVHKHRGTPSR